MLPNLPARASSITLPGRFGERGLAGDGCAVERGDRLFQILCLDSYKRVPLTNSDVVRLFGVQAALLEDGLDIARPSAVASPDAHVNLRDAFARGGEVAVVAALHRSE